MACATGKSPFCLANPSRLRPLTAREQDYACIVRKICYDSSVDDGLNLAGHVLTTLTGRPVPYPRGTSIAIQSRWGRLWPAQRKRE